MFAQSKESSKLYNERLNPDSESTLETSSFVTRDSIPIFSQIKNVKDDKEKKEKLNQLLDALRKKLPEGFKIGAAVGEGDCFFDSVAQGLNELKDKGLVENSERFNVKSLRKDCANDARKYEDKIVKDANEGGYFVPQKNIAFPHLENIKDKKGNDVPDVQETFDKYLDYIKSVATENGPIPIRERLDIEGRMICDKYKVKIKVIGLKEQPIGDTNVIESEQGEGTNVITMVNYKNHFVPLLSNLEEDIEGAILVSREEVYGIADEESPSLIEDIKNYDLEEGAEQQSQAQNQSNRDSLQGKIHLTAIDIYHGLNQVTFGSDDSGNSRGWADIDHINNFMNKVIANNDNQLAYYISPINFGFNEEEAIRDSLKHICRRVVDNSEINDHYGTELDKPFIFIANTETVLANDPTGIDKKEGGFHWISWVLLPKKYGNLLGEEISNDQYQVFFFDSFAKRKIPERLKDGLTKGTTFVEDQITVKLLPFCKENEIVFNDNNELTGQQMNGSDCGWWAVYYALMAVYTGGVEFLDPLKGKKLSAVPLRNIMNLQEASIIQQQSLQNRENHYKGSSVSAKSSLDQSSKEFIQSTEGGNLRICLQNTVIDDIAKYLYKWTEDNNVIFGVEGCGRLPSKLDKFKKNKDKTLIYIVNKDGNHWVTLVAIHTNEQEDVFFYADSFGVGIEECRVNAVGRGKIDSDVENKASQGNADRNGQNVEQNSDDDVIFVGKIAPLKQNGNDNICVPLDKFLKNEEYSEGNIHNLSILQQRDHWNCGVFALENAKAILNAVRNGNDDPAKVKESLKAVNKDVNHLNTLRKCFANSLTEVSPINKQSSVAFSSSSEKGIEESIEQEPLHNTENISRENERGITSQKRQGKKNFDDGKSYQKGVVSYEELEKQTLGKLKEISRRYILTDDEKEKKLSDFVGRQEKDRRKFNELWEGFVSLSNEEKKKAILRIFFFAEFWDSSQDENEGAFRNIVWNKLCDLNAQDYIFKESVDYLIPFVSNPLVSMHMYKNNNRLQRVLHRAKSSLLNDKMGNLIIKICIEIFNMRNTFNRGEFIKSGKVVECLSALKKFCEAGRKNKIADFELGDDQDCKIIYSLLGEKSKLNISSAIRSLIKEIKLKETEEKENALEGFINDLHKSKKDLTQIYQCDQIKGFLKQYDYYLITFAIDEVIQYNESPLEEVLSIAKDHFSEEEMNAMLERACKYIVDQRNKSVEGVAFDSEKAFRLLSDKLNSINRKKEEILKFLVDKLGKIQDFSENCQSSTLQQTLEEVVSYSPSRGKNTGNRNHESCSKNFFDELTMILDGGKTDKQDKIQSFISSRLSRYKGNCFYRLLLGEFLFENQDHAQISQKYLLLHLDSQSIAFLLTAGQREKAKTTVLSIIDKSRGPVPNISSFAIDYRNLQIVNLEIDPRKSHLLDGIKKEDIEQGYKIKFIPINEEVISFDLLRKAIKDVGSRKQVIDNLKNIVNFINYTFNLDNDKIKFSFIRDESDAKNLVDGLLMGSKHEIPSDDKIINEIISSLVKNNIQAKSNNIRDHRLPIADKRSGKKDKKKAEYYAYLSREYGIFSSQADVRGDRATFNRSAIRKNRKRPIINEEDYGCNALHLAIANENFDDVKKLIDDNEGYVKGRDLYGNTPLHFAVQVKNLKILQFLMDYIEKQNQKEGYFVDKNYDGCTPLHFAAKSGNVEVINKLLEFVGAEAKEGYVQSKNNKSETPLHFAARSGKAEVVSKLLEFVDAEAKEGYVQSKDSNDETPLHFAAKSGNVKVVEKLLKFVNDKEGYVKHENSNKCTPLHFAAWGSNVEVINKLLEFVDKKERKGYVQSKNNKGETPLHFAAKKNNVGVILSLIGCVTEREGKENYVKCTNKLLYTPLHFAARSGNVEVINKLLEFVGAEAKEGYVQSKNNKGETPLHFAARSGNVKAVERLLEYVNDKEGYVRAENNEKETSLHFVARSGNVEVINKLLEFVGAEAKEGYVQSKNNKGETPLHFAARRSGNVKAVERLLEYVNDKEGYVRAENNEKETSLHFAARSSNVEVINKLLEFVGAEAKEGYVQSKNNKGETPLHFAARSGNVKAVEKLLQFVGENEKENYIEFANNDNKNALDIAISCGNCKVFYELLKYIKNPEQKQHYLDLVEKASDSKKRNIHSSDNLQTKGCVKKRKKQRNSEGLTSQYSKKRPRISDGNTQKPPVKSDSPRQEVKIKSKVVQNVSSDKSYEQQDSNRESGSEESCSRSSSPDSQEGEQLTLNDVESNGENQEAFSRSSSTSDKNDNNHLSEESESRSSIDARDNNGLQNVFLQEGDSYNKLGDNCCSINDIAKGAECYEKTIEYYERVRKLDSRDMFITSIAHVSDKLGDIIEDEKAECYEKAMKYHGMAIDYLGGCSIDSLNDAASISMKLSDITKFMNKKDEYREISEKYYKRVDELKILEDLRLACDSRSRDWDAIKLFIDKIDNVNKLLNNEGTLLHLAATDGQREMVKYLLEKGANVTFGSKGGSTPLHKAAQKGHLDIVRMLLERNAAVNAVDRCGRTALHLAAQEGHLDVVEMLLEKRARSFLDQYNNTPLQLISKRLSQDPENDRLKEVQGFLSNFIENSDESSSVLSSSGSQEVEHTASNDISEKSFGDEKSVCSSPEQNSGSSLEQASNSSERNDLQSISLQGDNHDNDEVAVALKDLEHGSAGKRNDIDGGDVPPKNSDLDCLLSGTLSDEWANFISSMQGSCGIGNASPQGIDLDFLPSTPSVSDLFKSRSSSNDSDNSAEQESANVGNDESYEQQDSDRESDLEGCTRLHNAALEGHNEVVKTLLERGASIDSKDEDGCTPLHNAALKGHNEVVKTLLERGASIDSKDEDGRTPLHDAALEGHNEVVKTLLERGASIDSKDEDGCTPLHDAALEGHNEIVKTLLERGANVNALNNRKNSPFILAEEKSNHGVIEILKNENARLCRNYCEILEMQPGTNLNDVRSANQMRRRLQSF